MTIILEKYTGSWTTFLSKEQCEKLEEEISCAICFNIYKDPIVTNCHHLFCKACLEKSRHLNNNCPMCRQNIVEITNAKLEITTIAKKILKLGCSEEALDALKTEKEKLQYAECRTRIQKNILESSYFSGPWCCVLPNDLFESVIFRLRHQLELRGFILYHFFKTQDGICCRIVGRKDKDIQVVKEEVMEWNENFIAQRIFHKGKEKLDSLYEKIKNRDLPQAEKNRQLLYLKLSDF